MSSRVCISCHKSTVERMRVDKIKFVDRETTTSGLTCSKCNRFVCRICFQWMIKHCPKQYHDAWCKQVLQFLETGRVMRPFLGQCCEIKLKYIPPKYQVGNSKFTGLLHLYEFGLLINAPLDGVTDIHGLAADSSGLPGAWHCVLSQEAEQACARERVTLDGSKLIILQNEVKKNFLMNPVNGKGLPQKVSDSTLWPFCVCAIGRLFVRFCDWVFVLCDCALVRCPQTNGCLFVLCRLTCR
jgi:hypothetical protein